MLLLDRVPPPLLAAAGVATLSAMDAVIKHLGATEGTWEIAFGRYAMGTLVALAIWAAAGRPVITLDMLRAHGVRGIVAAGAGVTFFYGLPRVPLAEAIAFAFIAPLLIPFAAALILKETVRRESVIAGLAGFSGALVALIGAPETPRHAEYPLGVASILCSAVLYALGMALLRQRAGRDGAPIVGLMQAAVPMLVCAAPALAFGHPPAQASLPLFMLMGVLGAGGWFLLIKAYARAEAQRLAPLEFTAIGWASAFGLLFFQETPRPTVLIGAAIIIAACLFAEHGRRLRVGAAA